MNEFVSQEASLGLIVNLPRLGRQTAKLLNQLPVRPEIDWPMLDRWGSRIGTQEVVALPVARRAYWPGNKAAAAVRADIGQNLLRTGRAESAFVAADARVQGFW